MGRLSVATIISGALKLDYPLVAMLDSVAQVADEIVVVVDTGRPDGTQELLRQYSVSTKPLVVVPTEWDWGNTQAGSELAKQTNIAFDACTGDFILYIQADEGIHENQHGLIRGILANPTHSAYTVNRLYFWGSPLVIRQDWTQPLVRLFRRGSRTSAGDAMDTAGTGDILRTNLCLFHYSRMGDPSLIAQRIANLDSLYHPKDTIHAPDEYQFVPRTFDTYSTEDSPEEIEGRFVRYVGTHPRSFAAWYAARGVWG